MAELTPTWREVFEVVEQAIGGGQVVHGTYTTPEEAQARYHQVARQQPRLVQSGSIGIRTRRAELLAPVGEKMRRAGRDYEDKAMEARR